MPILTRRSGAADALARGARWATWMEVGAELSGRTGSGTSRRGRVGARRDFYNLLQSRLRFGMAEALAQPFGAGLRRRLELLARLHGGAA